MRQELLPEIPVSLCIVARFIWLAGYLVKSEARVNPLQAIMEQIGMECLSLWCYCFYGVAFNEDFVGRVRSDVKTSNETFQSANSNLITTRIRFEFDSEQINDANEAIY